MTQTHTQEFHSPVRLDRRDEFDGNPREGSGARRDECPPGVLVEVSPTGYVKILS